MRAILMLVLIACDWTRKEGARKRTYVCDIMAQHPRTEERLQHFWSRSVVSEIPTTSFLQPVLGELLVRRTQPFRARRIIWQEEEQEECANERNNAFDDEEPAEAALIVVSIPAHVFQGQQQTHPCRPAVPLIWPTPYAIAPPKAPARLQKPTTQAILKARSLCRYQTVMK